MKKSFPSHKKQHDDPPLFCQPTQEQVTSSNIGHFMEELGFAHYEALHQWSVSERDRFWNQVIQRLGIIFKKEPTETVDFTAGPTDPRWLPGALMNCVDSCFKASRDKPAIVSGKEDATNFETTTYGELEGLSNRVANGLLENGFEPGDGIDRDPCHVRIPPSRSPPDARHRRGEVHGGAGSWPCRSDRNCRPDRGCPPR